MTDIWHMDNRGQGVLNINAAMKTPTGEALLKHSKYREEIMSNYELHDQAQHLTDTMSPYQLAKLYLEKDSDVRCMVQKAADNHLGGYRELGNKCAELEQECESLKQSLKDLESLYDKALEELETYYD